MAVRIRKDGRVLCAAMHPEEDGDKYIDDGLHYFLSVEVKVLVTEPHAKHKVHGQWWWINDVPEGVEPDPFYLGAPTQPQVPPIVPEDLHSERPPTPEPE